MSGVMDEKYKATYRYKLANWVSELLWLELLFDIASIILFAWATTRVLILYATS
jgi:hypothetical protein